MEFSLEDWSPDERKEALEHTLEDYLEHLQRPPKFPAMPHYGDYLRAVVHALTAPEPTRGRFAPFPETPSHPFFNTPRVDDDEEAVDEENRCWGCKAVMSQEEADRHLFCAMCREHYSAEEDKNSDAKRSRVVVVEEEDEEEETPPPPRAFSYSLWERDVAMYCPACKTDYMRFRGSEHAPHTTCEEVGVPFTGVGQPLWDEQEPEEALEEAPAEPVAFTDSVKDEERDDETDTLDLWCPECCLRLQRSIARRDEPCGICQHPLSTALPFDWQERQLRAYRGSDLPLASAPTVPPVPTAPRSVPVLTPQDKEAGEGNDGNDGEETEGLAEGWYWCPTCQTKRWRSRTLSDPQCQRCRTLLSAAVPYGMGADTTFAGV